MAGVEDLHSERDPVKEEARGVKMERKDSSNGEVLRSISAVSIKDEGGLNGSTSPSKRTSKQSSSSPVKPQSTPSSPPEKAKTEEEFEEKIGGEITVKMAPGQPPKLARSASQKVVARTAPLFDHFEDKTSEATSKFQVIEACTYTNKNMGYTEHAMECDCTEEWDPTTKQNSACGEDSDCINRATKMECVGDCGCGADCENQRFQRRQYANVSVIKTEKKGYGLRADSELRANDFIFEYIGEVINEPQFRKRMVQYDDEGIKHFYFMSLSKGEFVDATKKGNLGRFCNHSCNPNCYVDKWVVGEKLRMGIFAERKIKAGEELVFNYNVDRYGADPQPCYCGEPNCTGFIGGKTQTERATKLSNATIEALGIDDGDGWDTAIAKKPRKKKTGEDDEEYVDSLQPKSLDEDGVTKVMAALMQCKEKWIAVKLLGRIQRCDDERVRNRVVKMHGYQILSSQLSAWKEDNTVVLQILDILDRFPKLTRNKIIDSKIEDTVKTLVENDDAKVNNKASALLEVWSTLEVGYRIPRLKRDPTAVVNTPEKRNRFERRESREERKRSRSRSRSQSPSVDAPRGPSAPTGPRSNLPQRNNSYFPGSRPPFKRPFGPLPAGWFTAEDKGKTYYYSSTGQTTWTRPTMPAVQPKPPPKPSPADTTLQNIIQRLENQQAKASQDKTSTPATPQVAPAKPAEKKEAKEDKWKSFSEDKQKKVYENTLAPHITYVVNKFKTKLPRDDLKRFAKECAKKLVASDYKHGRVENPTKLGPKQEKNVKKYVKEFLDKAVSKRREHEKKKAEKKTKEGGVSAGSPPPKPVKEEEGEEEEDIQMSDVEIEKDDVKESQSATPDDKATNSDNLKRKREDEDDLEETKLLDECVTSSKRARSESLPPPPPPPPPPPAQDVSPDQEQYVPMDQDVEAVDNNGITKDGLDARVEDQDGLTSGTPKNLSETAAQNGESKVNGYHPPKNSSTPEESPVEDISPMVGSDFEGLGREEGRRVQVEGQG